MIKLHQCAKGAVVVHNTNTTRIGHIIGFGRNLMDEMCVTVEWYDIGRQLVRPSNIELAGEDLTWPTVNRVTAYAKD